MKDRFKNRLYTREIWTCRNKSLICVESEDGTLFSGSHRTKIRADDLPEWYVFGRYYRCWGYLSTKGITDLLYCPNLVFNHFLKDDCLLISYGGKIRKLASATEQSLTAEYSGCDETVWGTAILNILKGAQVNSGFDISDIVEKIKEKNEWLAKKYPNEYGSFSEAFDINVCFGCSNNNR